MIGPQAGWAGPGVGMRGGWLLRLIHRVGAGWECILLGVGVDLGHGRHCRGRRVGGGRRAGSLLLLLLLRGPWLQAPGQAEVGRGVLVGRVVCCAGCLRRHMRLGLGLGLALAVTLAVALSVALVQALAHGVYVQLFVRRRPPRLETAARLLLLLLLLWLVLGSAHPTGGGRRRRRVSAVGAGRRRRLLDGQESIGAGCRRARSCMSKVARRRADAA